MIDYNYAVKAFNEYLKDYDINDKCIKLKIVHTYHVVENSKFIAESLGLDSENVELAKVIGLLHDIGRFEQLKLTGTFDDSKYDHAVYGAKALDEDKLIYKFVKDRKYDYTIIKSVLNHNRLNIEDGLDDNTLMHAKIIRDADKLDIFRVRLDEPIEAMFPTLFATKSIIDTSISTKVYDDFMNHLPIKLLDRKTITDYWICTLAFIYDMNYDCSLKFVRDNNLIEKLVSKLDDISTDKIIGMDLIEKCAIDYLNNI